MPQVLIDTECQLEISQHGTHQDYFERFREVKAIVWSWRKQYPKIRINIRKSHKGWMRQYNIVDEARPPLPNIIWSRLPPDHPDHLPPGFHYPDNLPEGHPGHYYPGMPPYPVTVP